MTAGDLFAAADAIRWDETGQKGVARDGRRVTLEHSALTGRVVAIIPLHGRDVVTRRSCRTVEQARAAAEAVIGGAAA